MSLICPDPPRLLRLQSQLGARQAFAARLASFPTVGPAEFVEDEHHV
jgi:hypothetical protein